jgi:hypothetical protein
MRDQDIPVTDQALRLHGQAYAEWDRRDGGLGNGTLMGSGPRARLQNGKNSAHC